MSIADESEGRWFWFVVAEPLSWKKHISDPVRSGGFLFDIWAWRLQQEGSEIGGCEKKKKRRGERTMGAVETAVILVVAILLGWGAIEIACKPCLQTSRSALNRSLDPDYDPDDEIATPYVEAAAPGRAQESSAAFPESPKKPTKFKGESAASSTGFWCSKTLVPISQWWLLFDADRKMQLHAII